MRNIAFAPFGNRTNAEFPPFNPGAGLNTVVSTRSYNKRSQVASVQVMSPGGMVVARAFDYARTTGGAGPIDRGPNLDEITDTRDGSLSRFFFYDSLDRLQKSTQLSGSPLYQYSYDPNGNRTTEASGGVYTGITYVPGTDRVATLGFDFGFGTITVYYHHDAYGNRVWEALSAPYSGQPMHYYDDQNRLVEYRHWTNLSVPAAQYTYDAFGRRVRKLASGSTTVFFYDLEGQLLEERIQTTGSTRNYVWLENEPVGVVDSGSTPTYSWIHTDYLGMPIAVTNTPSSGGAQTIWRANYAPYGLAGEFKDPDGDGQQFALALRFPGQYADVESNYHYNWHRYYDPSIGRYISADPIGQEAGPNIFTYVNGNPVNWVDPFGLDVWICDRPTNGPMPGNHSYLYDDETGRNEGRGGKSLGGGEAQSAEDPLAGGDSCEPIPGTDGLEESILDDLNDTANTGPWLPFANDCHNSINRSLERHGIPPVSSPNGRFGSSNRGALSR